VAKPPVSTAGHEEAATRREKHTPVFWTESSFLSILTRKLFGRAGPKAASSLAVDGKSVLS
jgi:hypothetical protein